MFLKYLHENGAKPTQNSQKQTLSGVVKKGWSKKNFLQNKTWAGVSGGFGRQFQSPQEMGARDIQDHPLG